MKSLIDRVEDLRNYVEERMDDAFDHGNEAVYYSCFEEVKLLDEVIEALSDTDEVTG